MNKPTQLYFWYTKKNGHWRLANIESVGRKYIHIRFGDAGRINRKRLKLDDKNINWRYK